MGRPRSIFGYLEGESSQRRQRLSGNLARHEEWAEAILPADVEAGAPEGETNRRPLKVFGVVVAFVAVILAGRLFTLQIMGGQYNLALANGNRIRERVERAPRGTIYDRNRSVLASNQASYDVTVVPQLLSRDEGARRGVYAKVGAMLDMAPDDVRTKTETGCPTKIPKDCLASPIAQLVAAGVDRQKALLVDQASAGLSGFAVDVNPIRQYSDDNLLAVFLGYTGRVSADEVADNPGYGPTDLIGKLGLEKQYEDVLRGANGGSQTEVDATGKPIRVLASRDPAAGNSLVLSVDRGLQQHLATAMQKQLDASGAKRAAGVAMNPKTGEILAAVSLPGYDNNLFSRGISQADYRKLLADSGQPLFNKVASGGYPSGSIIKPFGAAAVLQEGIVTLSTFINDTGKIVIPNKYDPSKPSTYQGWERTTGLGLVNVLTAISRSSDIFFYEVMGGFTDFPHYLGIDRLADYYRKFGLGAKTGVDLPTEAAGRVPTPEWKKAFSGQAWYTGDTYNVSVGQGDLLVSPLQMASALSVIANGGTLYRPHFVDQIIDSAGKALRQIVPEVTRKNFVNSQNLATVRKGMWMTVNDANGTACCKIRDEVPVAVAAKTGTAETVVHDTGVDAELQSRPHSWFEAFAPYEDPQIVIVVLVEHSGEGAQYAAPAVRETLTWYFKEGAGKR